VYLLSVSLHVGLLVCLRVIVSYCLQLPSDSCTIGCTEMLRYEHVHVATLHRATLNRATVKRRHFNGRQLTGATINRVPLNRATPQRKYHYATRPGLLITVSSEPVTNLHNNYRYTWTYYH